MIAKRLFTAMAVLAVMFIANTNVMAQDKQAKDEQIYDTPETMPEYPGGMEALSSFLSENIVYPDEAQEKGISGRVMVQYVIEKDGSVTEVKVMKGVDPLLDAEAVRVVKAMPKWKPGTVNGKPVRVKYMLPIVFKIK